MKRRHRLRISGMVFALGILWGCGSATPGAVHQGGTDVPAETSSCGDRGPCEAGATCETATQRCVCAALRQCVGEDNGQRRSVYHGWRCQDRRCPTDLGALISQVSQRRNCSTERDRSSCGGDIPCPDNAHRRSCPSDIPCEDEGLYCGSSGGEGCGSSGVSCFEGYWHSRSSPPAN